MSLLSVIAKTLEKSFLHYVTANILNTPTQHGYKTQHSTLTALHTLNNTVAKGFNQMAPHVRTITVALDMNKAFNTLIGSCYRQHSGHNYKAHRKLHQGTQSLYKIQKPQVNQRQFKTGVPHGGVISPTLFNICTAYLPPPRSPVQVMTYADDITITSTLTITNAAKKYIQPYLHKVIAWTKQNNLTLNPGNTNCILFTPDHVEYTSNLYLKINNTALHMHYTWQHTQMSWVLP